MGRFQRMKDNGADCFLMDSVQEGCVRELQLQEEWSPS